jgi:flagellar assembly factor FliW
MNIKTKFFGEIEKEEKDIIFFNDGLPGFEEYKKFIIFSQGDDYFPFLWMQSVDESQVAFIIIDPKIPVPNYFIDVSDSEIEELEIKDESSVSVYTIVVITKDNSRITANLKAPIIINNETNKAKQVIINNEYDIRHIIFENQKTGG